ncbi:MAG: YlxM family DNA-binding protein [Oscillospiraceae bacterium]
MAKDLKISLLLDFYGDMITEKQREVVDYYYNEDLSLAEIAEHCCITRQGVRDSIKRAEQQLLFYEETLHVAEKFSSIQEKIKSISICMDNIHAINVKSIKSLIINEQCSKVFHIIEQLKDEEVI